MFVDAKQHVWVTHPPETLTEQELYEGQKPPMASSSIITAKRRPAGGVQRFTRKP